VAALAVAHDVSGPAEAPVLVLAGSLGADRSMWDGQLAGLTDGARVVRYDHRGHGASPVPAGPYALADLGADVLGLLDALGVERASFCGLSLGGMVGMWLAANAPARIDRLVVVCTSAHLPPAEGWLERARAVRAAQTTEAVADAVLARWLTPAFAAERPGELRRLRAMLVATPPEGYARACEAIAAMDLRPDLGRIAAPTLVIVGEDDPATPPPHGELIARGIAGARLERVASAAHLANVEQADAVTRLVRDHVQGGPR
jgi:3-oxoadipate enol-lactonase